MEVISINNIKNNLAGLEKKLPTLRQYLVKNYRDKLDEGLWGREKEYSPNRLMDGIESLITELNFLIRNPDYFIRLSTYDTRTAITRHINWIVSYIPHRLDVIPSYLDDIKDILAPYNLGTDKEKMIALQDKIESLSKELAQTSLLLENAKATNQTIKRTAEKVNEIAEIISQKDQETSTLLDSCKSNKEETDELKVQIKEVAEIIAKLHTESSDAKTSILECQEEIHEFAKEIDGHQERLEEQEKQFDNFKTTLDEYTKQQEAHKKEAEALIEKARKALNYTTSYGLSDSFNTQCQALKGEYGYKLWLWIIGAGIAIAFVICISYSLIDDTRQINTEMLPSMLMQIIGKISMIPLLVTAAIFCANQYTKQKNLLEDYSYKLTLAKSMVAFSEELREKDPEKYQEYLSMVLREIHQDPLRYRVDPNNIAKRGKGVSEEVKAVVELLKDVSNIAKP